MQNKWFFKELSTEEESKKEKLAKELNLPPTIVKMLLLRGITTQKEVESFFNPKLEDLHNPMLIQDMDKAVKRLTRALEQKENILVYGDYDVDGTTAVALVYKFLKPLICSPQVLDYYIPDRYNEGYGISFKGIDYAKEHNINLIIALDCGIKAIDEVEYAKSLGIDCIICDHHTTDIALPIAVAVLDSKRSDDNYPYKHLSGCGVGYKLMQAFASANGIPKSDVDKHLDLLAVSIASDIVPITGENRILAYYGIKRLNEQPCCGLKAIMEVCEMTHTKEISINDIVFKIGPRINASGRMKSGREVVELLISNDFSQAYQLSKNINSYNDERRNIDKDTTLEAEKVINETADTNNSSIIVYNPNWHKGIVGIVASRLTEKYYKPTIVLTKANDMISGSARSIQGFDLYQAIDSCRGLLENFGGHTYAAGLSLKEENLDKFKQQFCEYVSNNITPELLIPTIEIDDTIQFKDIDSRFVNILRSFEPFGPGNPKPYFCTKNIFDYNNMSKIVGQTAEHLKLEITDYSINSRMSGIAFKMSEYNKYLKEKTPINIVYTIEDNTYFKPATTQLMVKDIKY